MPVHDLSDPAVFYIALVLPGLFAITLIIEGFHKIFRDEAGWVSLVLGVIFLGVIATVYFILLK